MGRKKEDVDVAYDSKVEFVGEDLSKLNKLWSGIGWTAMVIIADTFVVEEGFKASVATKDLQERFYGKDRKEGNKASTSFNNKRLKAIEMGVIIPVEGMGKGFWALGEFGATLLTFALQEKNIDSTVLKSQAQLTWELQHPTS